MTSLSICIPSYNRPLSLLRTIKSITLPASVDLEIIVVDDCSPLQDNISKIIESLDNSTIKFYPLDANVGYDLNLLNCAKYASKEYLLFLSDDDTLNSSVFLEFFEALTLTSASIATTAYLGLDSSSPSRHYGKIMFKSPSNAKQLTSLIYNFILFSGIVVKRQALLSLLPLNVDGLVYSQLVWSSLLAIRDGYYSFPQPLIVPHGDGVIGFGTNSAHDSDSLLANRNMLLSPISYHRKLFASISYLSSESCLPRLKYFFSLEYTFRSYYLLKRAFIIGGRKGLLTFFLRIICERDIHLFIPLTVFYFLLIYLLGMSTESLFTALFGASPSVLYRNIKGGD